MEIFFMYTIQETYAEFENAALSVPGSAIIFGAPGRAAFIWKSYAEKHGVDCVVNVVRFYENRQWVDTWYPTDRETAQRLASGWINGSDEVKDRIAAALA